MRKLVLIAMFGAFGTLSTAVRAQFCPGVSPWVFDDVAASDPFCGYITWMAQNAVTLGCALIDANHRLYCPNDNVNRKQMAAFMNRLGNVRVEEVDTGPGLTGGPITGVGTIGLASTQLLPTSACATNQVPRWSGAAWTCATISGGTVTQVNSGTGLTGGPITNSGTLSIASGYQLPQACANGQVAKSNGSGGWTCASDANSGGTVTQLSTGAGLSGGPITTSGTVSIATGGVTAAMLASNGCSANQVLKWSGSAWACQSDANSGGTVTSITAGAGLAGGTITGSGTIAVDPASSTLSGNFFKQGGNAFGGTAVLGTNDYQWLELRVSGTHVMSYGPNFNIAGGHPNNSIGGWAGQTIAGGGAAGYGCYEPSTNTADRPCANRTDGSYATVSGGFSNAAMSTYAFVGGGANNSGIGSESFVGGGRYNTASGVGAVVAGGHFNVASGSYSFAGGARAVAAHDGAFVWSGEDPSLGNIDSQPNFSSGAPREFAVRATGGARFVTAVDFYANPTRIVKINTNGELDFGAPTRQMLNLFTNEYGVGVQNSTLYERTAVASHFGWYAGGVHSNAQLDPGAGGVILMSLSSNPALNTPAMGFARAALFTNVSDRAAKTGFEPIDAEVILSRLATLPVTTWSYRSAPEVRHIGPVAQDFYAAFAVGSDDRTIATVDADGVALAAIQALNAKLESQRVEIARLRQALEQVNDLRSVISAMQRRLDAFANPPLVVTTMSDSSPH